MTVTASLKTKKMDFADKGTVLLHSTLIPYERWSFNPKNTVVAVWDLNNYQLRFTCPGVLVGKARDEETFLTYYPTDSSKVVQSDFRVWRVKTGQEIALSDVKSENYAFHQRTLAFYERTQAVFLIYDALNLHLSQPFYLSQKDSYESPDAWAISPDDKYLIITLFGDAAGHDWARGIVLNIDSNTGEIIEGSKKYSFPVNRFQGDPPLNFSIEHKLFAISDGNASLVVYNLMNWKEQYKLTIDDFSFQVSFHPKNPNLIAVSADSFSERNQRVFYIKLIKRGIVGSKIESVMQETGWINGLLFHPSGNYLISLVNNEIHIWDVARKKQLRKLSLPS